MTSQQGRKALVAAGAMVLALLMASAISWTAPGDGDPVTFRPTPGRDREALSLPRGEVLLFQFFQGLADATGRNVCYKGSDPPEKTIALPRALERLDAASAGEILSSQGYDLSEARYREKDVYWVQQAIVPPRKKGAIVRGSQRTEAEDESAGGSERDGPPAGRQGTVDLYVREQGGGARYVVTFQTNSRQEAEEAVSLLKAHQRARR